MKVVGFSAENVKRIKAVEFAPDGTLQIVAGRNAQGKSSILDSIWLALEYKAAGRATARPIRDGEDQAKVRLDLGDLIVTRTWEGDKSKLLVENAEGIPQQRPQELLDALIGKLSFDPLAFTQQGDKEQVQTLLGLVDLPFNPAELSLKRQVLYDKRTAVGQDLTRAKGSWETMDRPDPDLPDAEVSTADLLAEYQEAQDEITRHNDTRRDLDTAEREHDQAAEALKVAQERLNAALLTRTAARKAVDKLGEAPSLEPIKEALATAEATNAAIRDSRSWFQKKSEVADLKGQYEGLTAEIEALDKQKADGLAAAKFPVEGLSFGDEGVTYNGVPFNQASSAEQLRVSLALAMAMNPTLRVIRITDGSLLDSENLALIADMAKAEDFQVWVERVDESGTAGIVIEDGKVKKRG